MKTNEQMKIAYENGMSIREIARTVGRSYGYVHRHLVEAGTHLRSRGGSRRKKTAA